MKKKKRQNRDWWNNARIGKSNDKRIKLLPEDHQHIKQLHREGNPIREIARIYDGRCSRRMIQLVLFPERYARIKARAKETKRWEPYNTKEQRLVVMQTYRAHIREVHHLPARHHGPIPSDQ